MKSTSLKSIPQLAGLTPQERNVRVREAYRADRSLHAWNLLHVLMLAFLFPLAVEMTEWIIGHRSIFRSFPMFIGLAYLASFYLCRTQIYPRIRRALDRLDS